MCSSISRLAIAATIVLSVSGRAFSGEPGKIDASATAATRVPFETSDPIVRASLERIARGSTLWRRAAERLQQNGQRVVLLTPQHPTAWVSKALHRSVFSTGHVAEAVPLLRKDARVAVVLVFVNLPLIQEAHASRFSAPMHFEGDLDRILVHEVYGHGIPYLEAGDLTGRCADPRDDEPAGVACAIQRENAVRAELGLGQRDDRGLSSLSLWRGRAVSGHH